MDMNFGKTDGMDPYEISNQIEHELKKIPKFDISVLKHELNPIDDKNTTLFFNGPPTTTFHLNQEQTLSLSPSKPKTRRNKESKEKDFSRILEDPMQLPFHLLDPRKEIDWFLGSDLLKISKILKKETLQKIKWILKKQVAEGLLINLFWLVHMIKFYPDSNHLIQDTRTKTALAYSKIFEELKHEELKQDILNNIQFVYAYMIHSTHYKMFRKVMAGKFDTRFVLDCYHITIFELTGMLVSDFYIHDVIQQMFGDSFFFYRQEGVLSLKGIDPGQGSVFLDQFRRSPQSLEVLSMHDDDRLSDTDRVASYDLFSRLNRKFSYIENERKSKSGLLRNRLESQLVQEMMKLSSAEDGFEILKKKKLEIKKKRCFSMSKPQIKRAESPKVSREEQEFKVRASTYLQQKLPKLKKKFKFDCNQVSPPIRQIVSNLSLTSKQKMMTLSSFQVPDFWANDLDKLFSSGAGKKVLKRSPKNMFSGMGRRDLNVLMKAERGKKNGIFFQEIFSNFSHFSHFFHFFHFSHFFQFFSNFFTFLSFFQEQEK